MARKKRESGCVGCLTIIVIGLALAGLNSFIESKNPKESLADHPWMVVGVVGGILFLFALIAAVVTGKHECPLCGDTNHRRTHTWTIDNKRLKVCPSCNRSLLAKKRKKVMKELGD